MGRKIPVLVPFLFSWVTRPCCRENSALSSMTTRPCSREDKKVPCRAFVRRVKQVARRGASQLRHGSVRMLKNHDDVGGRLSLFPLPFPRVEGSASKDSQLLLNKVYRTLSTHKKNTVLTNIYVGAPFVLCCNQGGYGSSAGLVYPLILMSERNSSRVLCWLNAPQKSLVVVMLPCFSTPRICMHMCWASTTTITPWG